MSASDSHCTNEEQGGCEDDGEVTILFDDNTSLMCPKRALEAASPILKTRLDGCRFGGSLRLSGTSKGTWKLILHHITSVDPSPCFSNRIKWAVADGLTAVIRECQMYGITSLPEAIDEQISQEIATADSYSRLAYWIPPYDYQYFYLSHRFVNFVRQNEMVKSEKALAAFLVKVIKENERILKLRSEDRKKPHIKGYDSAVGRILRFVYEMHDAERYRFCFFFAKGLMIERLDSFSKEFSDILDETRYNWSMKRI